MFEIELPPYALEAAVALTVVLGVLAFLTAKDTPLPGPMELPIVSNGLEVSKHLHRLLYYVLDKSREYGTTWTFKIPFVPRFVVVLDRESTFHILKSHFKNYEKGPMFHENLKDLLGDGIFNSDGHRWYVQRKTASHLFSSRMLETVMLPVFEKHTDTVCEQLAAAAKAGSEVDMQDTFHRFTLDSIGEIGFGAPIGSLEDPENPFAKAFDGAQFIAEKRFFTPLWKLSEPFTAAGASFRRSIDVMDSYSFKLIKQRRESGDYLTGEDVLSRFMRLEADDGSMAVLHDDKYLRDVVMNFIIAGRDTTAQALSWSVYMLAQHPEVEARMLAEVEECFPAGTVPSLAAVKSLKYTRAVVLETLRLWPSVPKDSKQAVEDDVLPDGTKIRAGWVVIYVPFVMGRDEAIWGKDAGEFKPTRFLDTTDPDPYMYPVFNAGERQCLGKNMALLEAVMALACIYRRFHLKLVPGQDIQPLNSLTMPQARGVRVHAVPRTSVGSA